MNRKTLFAGAIFAGLVLVAIGLLRSPEKGTRPPGERPRPIPRLKAGDFDTLEITKSGATTVIKKQGDDYQIVKPVAYPADKDAAKTAFEATEKIEFNDILSREKSRHNEFEVGDNGLRVAVRKGDKLLADLRIGKNANDETMVRPEGKDEVWAAVKFFKYQFDKDTPGWRDKHIARFEDRDADKIEIDHKTRGRIVMSRPAPTDASATPDWSVVEAAMKVEPFDKRSATDLDTTFSTLVANEFVDNPKPEETGLDSPENTITVSTRNGKQFRLLVGNKKDDDNTYVKMADKPQVFLVRKFMIEQVNKRPIDFRDKTICNLASDEITEVSVARDKDPFVLTKSPGKSGDEAWKLSKPTAKVDISKANAIAGFFHDWKAQKYAEDNLPKTAGLAKPAAIISVKSNVKGHACTLKVGGESPDKGNYYVIANNQPNVYLVAKTDIDRITVKLDEVKAK
ncbi:MAG TPA: DUF4340 domain-containing protein [Polyangia bacterium]|jgi:hypothetical protein|nr:DUF4340 domain-containing protein [Polyangia bacterium]